MSGRICLWRYRERTRSYPGFHLSADAKGCEQLLKLLGGLAKVRAPQIATVTLDPVTAAVLAVPNIRDATASAFRHWDLIADPRFDPERFHFTVMNDRVRSELSSVQIESVAAGVLDIRDRRGDYAIGDEDEQQLWFWWQTGD
jgi:hypothetical protein